VNLPSENETPHSRDRLQRPHFSACESYWPFFSISASTSAPVRKRRLRSCPIKGNRKRNQRQTVRWSEKLNAVVMIAALRSKQHSPIRGNADAHSSHIHLVYFVEEHPAGEALPVHHCVAGAFEVVEPHITRGSSRDAWVASLKELAMTYSTILTTARKRTLPVIMC
jgi:hypothetical protein